VVGLDHKTAGVIVSRVFIVISSILSTGVVEDGYESVILLGFDKTGMMLTTEVKISHIKVGIETTKLPEDSIILTGDLENAIGMSIGDDVVTILILVDGVGVVKIPWIMLMLDIRMFGRMEGTLIEIQMFWGFPSPEVISCLKIYLIEGSPSKETLIILIDTEIGERMRLEAMAHIESGLTSW